MGKTLRILRIAVQALMLTLVTMGIVGAPAVIESACTFSLKVQIVPTMIAMSTGIFVLWVIITLIFGRIYCSSVCPIGTIQDVVAAISHRRRDYRFSSTRISIAMVTLVATLALAIAGIPVLVDLLDPFRQYDNIVRNIAHPHLLSGAIALTTLAIVATMAWRHGRLYCNTICPVGGGLALISRISFFKIEIDPDRCVRCNKCVDVCKSECIEMPTCIVDSARCVTCFNCLPVCPNDAIHYTPDRKQLSTPMFQRISPINTQPTACTPSSIDTMKDTAKLQKQPKRNNTTTT